MVTHPYADRDRPEISYLFLQPGSLDSPSDAEVDFAYNETFHVALALSRHGTSTHDLEVQAFLHEGGESFAQIPVSEPMRDPEQVFEEAISTYVMDRHRALVSAARMVTAVRDQLSAGTMTPDEALSQLASARARLGVITSPSVPSYEMTSSGGRDVLVDHGEAVLNADQQHRADDLFLGGARTMESKLQTTIGDLETEARSRQQPQP